MLLKSVDFDKSSNELSAKKKEVSLKFDLLSFKIFDKFQKYNN